MSIWTDLVARANNGQIAQSQISQMPEWMATIADASNKVDKALHYIPDKVSEGIDFLTSPRRINEAKKQDLNTDFTQKTTQALSAPTFLNNVGGQEQGTSTVTTIPLGVAPQKEAVLAKPKLLFPISGGQEVISAMGKLPKPKVEDFLNLPKTQAPAKVNPSVADKLLEAVRGSAPKKEKFEKANWMDLLAVLAEAGAGAKSNREWFAKAGSGLARNMIKRKADEKAADKGYQTAVAKHKLDLAKAEMSVEKYGQEQKQLQVDWMNATAEKKYQAGLKVADAESKYQTALGKQQLEIAKFKQRQKELEVSWQNKQLDRDYQNKLAQMKAESDFDKANLPTVKVQGDKVITISTVNGQRVAKVASLGELSTSPVTRAMDNISLALKAENLPPEVEERARSQAGMLYAIKTKDPTAALQVVALNMAKTPERYIMNYEDEMKKIQEKIMLQGISPSSKDFRLAYDRELKSIMLQSLANPDKMKTAATTNEFARSYLQWFMSSLAGAPARKTMSPAPVGPFQGAK